MENIKSDLELTNASIDECKLELNEIDALIEHVSQRVSESKEDPEREAFPFVEVRLIGGNKNLKNCFVDCSFFPNFAATR